MRQVGRDFIPTRSGNSVCLTERLILKQEPTEAAQRFELAALSSLYVFLCVLCDLLFKVLIVFRLSASKSCAARLQSRCKK